MIKNFVTGCDDFIGASFVRNMLKKYTDIKNIIIDALAHAVIWRT